MNPTYWIGIGALAGALIGFLLQGLVGWLDTTTGLVAGVLIGAIAYNYALNRNKSRRG